VPQFKAQCVFPSTHGIRQIVIAYLPISDRQMTLLIQR
jgi:hypothetical protein